MRYTPDLFKPQLFIIDFVINYGINKDLARRSLREDFDVSIHPFVKRKCTNLNRLRWLNPNNPGTILRLNPDRKPRFGIESLIDRTLLAPNRCSRRRTEWRRIAKGQPICPFFQVW